MSYMYKSFLQDHLISIVRENLLQNNAVGEVHYVRSIQMHNSDDTNGADVQIYFVPQSGGAGGTWNANDRIYFGTIAAKGKDEIVFPAPGLPLNYLDRLEAISSVDVIINTSIYGGRDY